MTANPRAIEAIELAQQIEPMLKGREPAVTGACLAQLLAIWVAGHHTVGSFELDALHEIMLQAHLDSVREMVKAVMADRMKKH